MSIENPTLAHFRHFIPKGFISLFTNLPAYKALYLRAYKAPDIYVPIRHYICRESSTNQLLFMQNKPNVKVAQINVKTYKKSNYEKLDTWLSGKNKPNSNPIKPNFRKAKMNVNLTLPKDYRKKDDFVVRINKPNSNPIYERPKMNVILLSTKVYENITTLRLQKNKPNQTQSPAPLVRVLYTIRGPAPKLRRFLITLFGSGYAGLRHSGSVYFKCAYSCSALLMKKSKI